MSATWWSLALAILGVMILVVHALDLRRQRVIRQNMEELLADDGQAAFDEIALVVRENKHVLASYHDEAREFSREGRAEKAVEWMRDGSKAIEELAPSYLAALHTLGLLTRALSAVVPLQPIQAYAFHTWRLRGLAGAGMIAHHLLLTGKERMLLRLRLIGAAFRWGVRWLRRSTERAMARPEEWTRIDALVADIDTTQDESQATAQRVFQTLHALERLREQIHARRA
jgi:hypothetical protein